MMKLTVAFLATLAAADASNNMRHRHVRRQGYGYGPGPAVPAANSTVATSSTSLTSPSPVALTSTDVSPEKPTNPTGPGNVPTYGDGKPSPSVPGVTFPGTGTVPGTAPATEVATPLPTTTTSLSPVEGGNTTSTSPFPTFHITGTDGTFPTAVPSGISPTGTGPAGENSVTVTITSYQVFTSTMCPEGVANCAGTAKTTKLITSAVPIGTTVCDKSKASSIMASGLHSTPASATGTATDTSVGAVGTPVPSTVVEHETKTLTATVGTGENAHLTTYTVTNKITKTEYVTAGPSASQNGEAPKPEPTTTLTTDITSTIGVTMTVTEGLPGAPTGGNGYPTGPKPSGVPVTPEGSQAPGAGECAPPVTVTVTAKETVTVTEGSSTGTAVPDDVPSHETSTGASGPSGKPTGVPHHTKPSHSEKPSGMPTGAPYPIGNGNGTAPVIPGSTGFVTSTKPSGPRPTGEVPGYGSGPAPSGSSSSATLPTFVLPSATPAGQPATETSTSPEAPAPVESGAYGPGYGYGSKKRGFLGLF